MAETDPRVQAFFDADEPFKDELQALRAILQRAPLSETLKWKSPCYTRENANVATIWSLKDHCALAFFKGVLLKDPEGLLHAPGENSQTMRKFIFKDVRQVAAFEQVIVSYVEEAISLEKAGVKVQQNRRDLVYPEELVQRMEQDDAFEEAFEALTPGRRRGYLLHFCEAKQSATRVSRIARHAERILMGKGMHDK